ncbi:MAG: hypothetical protein ACI396_02385, partial [Acutalibacteraceae bacterium]
MGIEKWLEYCGYTVAEISTVQTVWRFAGIPITMLAVGIYIFRTLRRRYSYSYMLDYYAQLRGNGYSTCPRCGSSVSVRQGKKSYREHVGDRVTTTKYSDGSTSTNRDPIYETRYYKYTYHQCDNNSCAISDDGKLKFGDMPYSRRDLHSLIFNDASSKHSAGYLVNGGRHFMRILIAIIVIAAVAVLMLMSKNNTDSNYGQFGGKAVEGISVTATLGEEEKALLAQIRQIIDKAGEYELNVDELNSGLFQKNKSVDVTYFVDDKLGSGFTYEFDGIKSDSGLEGEYTVMTYDGKTCVFCGSDETIYPPDSDFYKEHYKSLKKWDGKEIMLAKLDKIKTGELYEKYKGSYVLRSDKISVFIADDGSVRLLDETNDASMRYIFKAIDTKKPSNYANYRLLGSKDSETDPLQKILNTADYSAYIEFTENGKELDDICYTDNGDGSHTFSIYHEYKNFKPGKYTIYPEEKRYELCAYINDTYTLSDKTEKHTSKDSPETYNWLNDMIPDNFVKAHLSLDTAEKGGILWMTTYTEKVDGKDKAVLSLDNDKVKKFCYYETEKDFVEIRW